MDRRQTLAQRPLPEIDATNEPYWAAARRHELVLQRCAACREFQFPPEITCTHCGGTELAWETVSGRAALYTWTVAHPPVLPYFQDKAPLPIAVVQLDEGPRLVTSLLDVPLAEYEIGMRVRVDWEEVDEEVTLPVFRRA